VLQVKNGDTAGCRLPMSTTVKNLVTIAQFAAELLRFFGFRNGGQPPSWILVYSKNNITARCGLTMATNTPNLVKITEIAAEIWRFSFFQYGGRPPY